MSENIKSDRLENREIKKDDGFKPVQLKKKDR